MRKAAFILFVAAFFAATFAFQARVLPKDGAEYVSEEQCKMCHAEKHKQWFETRMARAFDLLIAAGREKDPECLPCHTTGFGKGGFKDIESTPNLKGVQCEACHGPGGDHMGDPEGIVGKPPAAVCRDCHKDALHKQ